MPVIFLFLDTCGAFWETCTVDDPGAAAFGPRGCARPTTWHTFGSLRQALDAGRQPPTYKGDDGWIYVIAPGTPCPRCDAPLLAYSPAGNGVAACDACCAYWDEV